MRPRSAVSLFTGAGGLDIGLEKAGFDVRLCVEHDPTCQHTLQVNRPSWPVATPGDIYQLSPAKALRQAELRPGELDLLIGGPPCQPFSKAGYWRTGDSGRLSDPRSRALDAYLAYVRDLQPTVILLENVKGLAYAKKDDGLRRLRDGLEELNHDIGTRYEPVVLHLNAARYGVPQLRERIFIVAHIGGLNIHHPRPTHACPKGDLVNDPSFRLQPYRTAWDAIGDLDTDGLDEALRPTGKWAALLPSIPEGENYLWHTPRREGMPLFGWRTRYWSFMLKLAKDRPSWTISAQPGPATGPFHWKNRKLSPRELCRLQTFPDDYEIQGSYRDVQRQLGNAVPPALGELLGLEITRQLFGDDVQVTDLHLIPKPRVSRPEPHPVQPVPRKYLPLCGDHRDHPGTGRGPSAGGRSTSPALIGIKDLV